MSEIQNIVKVPAAVSLLAEMMVKGYSIGDDGFAVRCIEGLPEGAKLVRHYSDNSRDLVWFVFEHESFAPVKDGDPIPDYPACLFERVKI